MHRVQSIYQYIFADNFNVKEYKNLIKTLSSVKCNIIWKVSYQIVKIHLFLDRPNVDIHLGGSLNSSNIREFDDVYFECR